MNANEIVKALRCFSNCDNTRCHDCGAYEKYCEDHAWKDDYYEIAAGCIESLQAEIDGMRSNWYKCAENYQQKCRDIAELEVELEKNNGCFWCSGDVPLDNVKINGVAVNISCCPMCGKQLEVEHI